MTDLEEIPEEKNVGIITDRNEWVKLSRMLSEANYPLSTVEDLSRLVTTQTVFADGPVFICDGNVGMAKTHRFADIDEATKFANEIKVLYHFVRLENEYIVRGWDGVR